MELTLGRNDLWWPCAFEISVSIFSIDKIFFVFEISRKTEVHVTRVSVGLRMANAVAVMYHVSTAIRVV